MDSTPASSSQLEVTKIGSTKYNSEATNTFDLETGLGSLYELCKANCTVITNRSTSLIRYEDNTRIPSLQVPPDHPLKIESTQV
jgi:hypothetical protein